jgi:hypothetical protein
MLADALRDLYEGLRGRAARDPAAEIRELYAANHLDQADALAVRALRRSPRNAALWMLKGEIAARRTDYELARGAFHKACELAPGNETYRINLAYCHLAMGETEAAGAIATALIAKDANGTDARTLLAIVQLPGPDYLAILQRIHARLKPATYLEIGVDAGRTMALASSHTQAIGVDPEPKIQATLGGHVRILRETSDDFFARHDVHREFGGRAIDLAFIDGMHQCEFALRDFANTERLCSADSVILIHDCIPQDRLTAAREQRTTFWSGDVWKTVVALKQHRPDLDIKTIAAFPTGLAVIRNLNPASRVLTERMSEIVAAMTAMDYAMLEANKRETLNWLPNEWPHIDALFPERPALAT